ncbi:MAG: SpoIIE family protein phosphatase [Bryobacteraceae bacterium]|jgi:sigma-B regulation protein RsbU (phosphoserine phosphatase)
MSTVWDGVLRGQIVERRQRLQSAIAASPERAAHLVSLLQEVDSALERIDADSFGLCEECHQSVEKDRLIADPLLRFCLGCLTEDQRRALEDDLDLAARIQAGLLPKPIQLAGWEVGYHYQPSGVVSGDYCDLIHHQNGTGELVFLVGDVSGKGVAAAMLMSHLHAMFRSLIGVGMPVERLVERANRLFVESTIATHFATLVCGRATQQGEVELCNAGHCPPLVVRDGEVMAVEAAGLPIGIFGNAEFSSTHIGMSPGDFVVLYTDGLSEARGASREEYGRERLAEVVGGCRRLAPQEVIGACLQDLAGFRSRTPLDDDLTLMVVRRTPCDS